MSQDKPAAGPSSSVSEALTGKEGLEGAAAQQLGTCGLDGAHHPFDQDSCVGWAPVEVPRRRIAAYLMCNILGKQTDPDWRPDEMELRIVASAIDGYVRAELARDRATSDKPRAAPADPSDSAPLEGLKDLEGSAAPHSLTDALEALRALRQQVEDTIGAAQVDLDGDDWIAAYHFRTGAIHRLLAAARDPAVGAGKVYQTGLAPQAPSASAVLATQETKS